MIMIGDPRCIPMNIDNLVVFNYSSPVEGIEKLELMPPMFDWKSELDFDMWYANWLLNYPPAFKDLMRVMYSVYSGLDVYLCASIIPQFEPINESFIKFIQQRYGYNCYIINTQEDLEFVRDYGSGFSIEGLANFDIDKERISLMAMEVSMNNSKTPKNDMINHEYDFISGSTERCEYGPK